MDEDHRTYDVSVPEVHYAHYYSVEAGSKEEAVQKVKEQDLNIDYLELIESDYENSTAQEQTRRPSPEATQN